MSNHDGIIYVILMILNSLFVGGALANANSQQINNLPQLDLSKYYFESNTAGGYLTLLVNTKPTNLSIYCFSKEKNKWVNVTKDVVFYKNIIGYKADVYKKECLNKIKIVDDKGEVVYYRDFSFDQ